MVGLNALQTTPNPATTDKISRSMHNVIVLELGAMRWMQDSELQ
jgi:hypothetical protein